MSEIEKKIFTAGDELVVVQDDADGGDNEGEDATWGDVCRSCCVHSPAVWAMIIFRLFWVAFFLYFFILGLEILGDGAQVMTGCAAGGLFSDDMNPISALVVGILVNDDELVNAPT